MKKKKKAIKEMSCCSDVGIRNSMISLAFKNKKECTAL
jgi:hypothetical protein